MLKDGARTGLIFPEKGWGGVSAYITEPLEGLRVTTPRNPERLKTINGQMLQRDGTPQKQGEKCKSPYTER